MTTIRLSIGLIVALTLAACGGAVAPTPDPSPTPAPPTARPTPTPVPGDSTLGGGGGGSGGSDPGGGGGIIVPVPGGGDPNQDPLLGVARYLTPTSGLVSPRPVNVQLVRAFLNNDGTAVADLRWYSGVAPCNQLDHVELVKDDAAKTIRLTVIEGSGPGDIACIEIAELHATLVDLGSLASGTWTISADGDAPPVPLDVP